MLVELPEQQAAIAAMRKLRAAGMSLRAIAAALQTRHRLRVSDAGVSNGLGATDLIRIESGGRRGRRLDWQGGGGLRAAFSFAPAPSGAPGRNGY